MKEVITKIRRRRRKDAFVSESLRGQARDKTVIEIKNERERVIGGEKERVIEW